MIPEELKHLLGDPPETNIKYCNSEYERRNKKELKEVSVGTPNSQTYPIPRPSAPLGITSISLPLSASPVPLQGGTTSVGTEVVKAKEGSGPDIHYAKITTRRPVKNTRRRKINFDFNVAGSNKINKLTFATTHEFWEWHRDIKADRADGTLTDEEYAWYERVAEDYKLAKQEFPQATIGKGCQRGISKAVKHTAIIYTGLEAQVYIGSWQHAFELEPITSGPAAVHHDTMAEYRANRTGYQDLTWE
jgi:hypothetical protein